MSWATRLLSEAPPVARATWAVAAAMVLALLAALLFLERKAYGIIGREKPWLALRLGWLPIVVATGAGVMFAIPVKSGMESLAWLFILAATLGPLLYFGLHVLVGRALGLNTKESLALAATGLLILVVPAVVAGPAQQVGWMAQWAWSARESAKAPESPPGHTLLSAQRLTLPGGEELWSQHWSAGPQMRQVESVEAPPYGASGSAITQRFTSLGSWICRDGEDLHVTWPATMKATVITVRWRDAEGLLRRSELRVAEPLGAARPLEASWSVDGVTLGVRPPRMAAVPGNLGPEGGLDSFGSMATWEPHESPQDFCLPRPYSSARPFNAMALRIERQNAEPLRPLFIRPAESKDPGLVQGRPAVP